MTVVWLLGGVETSTMGGGRPLVTDRVTVGWDYDALHRLF